MNMLFYMLFSSRVVSLEWKSDKEHDWTPLTLVWVGFLGLCFEARGDGGKTTPLPHLKLLRTMLETWNLVRKYTHICSLRKYTF